MSQSKLRQVLAIFENAGGPLSVPQIAHDLDVSPQRLDMMIQHWVRKGKIRKFGSVTECGTCGKGDSCAFVMDMPTTYELATADNLIPLHAIGGCQHKIVMEG